jgi:hypothetical protein
LWRDIPAGRQADRKFTLPSRFALFFICPSLASGNPSYFFKGSSPLRGGVKSAFDLNSRNGCNSTGSIAMKITTLQLVKFSLCRYGLKVSDLF